MQLYIARFSNEVRSIYTLHKGSVERKYLNEKLPPCQSYAQYLFEKSYNYDPFRYTCIFHRFDVCFALINILDVFI